MTNKKPTYKELENRIAFLEDENARLAASRPDFLKNSYFSALFEATDNICSIKDLNLRVIAANQAFLSSAGKKDIKELLGKTDAEIYQIPEDEDPIKGYMEDERAAQKLPKGKRILREEKIIYPDKSIGTILTSKFPVFNAENKVIATANISVDITERVKVQQKLNENREGFKTLNSRLTEMLNIQSLDEMYQFVVESLHQQFPDTIVIFISINEKEYTGQPKAVAGINNKVVDKVSKLLGYNPHEKSFNLLPKHEKLFKQSQFLEVGTLKDFVSDDFSLIPAKAIEKLLKIHKIYSIGITEENELIAAIHMVARNKKSIEDSHFIEIFVKGAGAIIRNKTVEQELIKSESNLMELNRTKDKLFSIIAHDLKNPLNNLIGFSELIEKNYHKYSDDKIRKFNKLIFETSRSVSVLLENLLTWSRSQQNKIPINPEPFNVFVLVENCYDLFRLSIEKKQVKLKNNIEMDQAVVADLEMVYTVFRNLLSNAIKFSPHGGSIEVHAKTEGKCLVIGISDKGEGIKKDEIKNIFKIKRTAPKVGTAGEKGSGLGLIICKDFIEKNKGKIWVESTYGNGSTFYFSLPRAD